jgi:hypothetical protein
MSKEFNVLYAGDIYCILQVFHTWDNLYLNKEDAQNSIIGWEHKERVREYYILVDDRDIQSFKETGNDESYKYYLMNSFESAMTELKESETYEKENNL